MRQRLKRLMHNQKNSEQTSKGTISVVDRNIKALIAQKQSEEEEQNSEQKVATAITRASGSMPSVAIHVVFISCWLVINLGWISGVKRFDPSLVILAAVASLESIFLSLFILITQRRMMAQSERRADLTLQISLLAEYEITRLITLNKQMAKVLGVAEANEPELEELSQDVMPEQVLQQLEEYEKKSPP